MKYIILSLKHSEGNRPCFWRADNCGYTNWPFFAGIYTEEQIKNDPDYYNNGYSAIPVPLTEQGMESIGLKITMDLKLVKSLKIKS